jgi:hypothetical protein
MKVAVIQSNYFPWKGYFDIIHDADIFCFYDEVKYTKNDWRNRNKICSTNGSFWLTIPIHKDAVKQKISEVELLDKSWQSEHYNTIYQTYKKTPFFHQLEPLLDDFYKAKEWRFLSEFNQYSIQKISKYIGIKTKFVNSKEYDLRGSRIDRLFNLLSDLNATEYISGPTAKGYLEDFETKFDENNILLNYKNYNHYPEYPQLGGTFDPFVSIIDLICQVDVKYIPNKIWAWRESNK